MDTFFDSDHSPSDNDDIRRILTVSELTTNIKQLLEETYPFVWICGEISNFRVPISGHFYFTLKDENAQINCVMFRGQNRNLKFELEDGLKITGLGRISVYEPRGAYQVIFEHIEPEGAGAIQIAFEQLKTRLAEEGLFDDKYKNPLPFLPQKISIITSPTGAVVHDILKIINRRFPNVQIGIIPVKVQGADAESEIVSGIEILNSLDDTDVAILARGGGSLEDLQAFNSEDVARAIFASNIPIISAVGHETDFTIADFVADLRAPTPSAAAEMVLPLKEDLSRRCLELSMNLKHRFFRYIEHFQFVIKDMSERLVDPRKKIIDFRLRTDDLTARLVRTFINTTQQHHDRLSWKTDRLYSSNPLIYIKKNNEKLERMDNNIITCMKIHIERKQSLIRELIARLNDLNPHAILDRGYSIVKTIPDARVVTDPQSVFIGQDLDVTVAKGSLICTVKRK
jgi:exodeoxyribonuclease VII large subunit